MTLMAVDYGTKRIGVAVTDRAEMMALSVGVFPVRSSADAIQTVRRLTEERAARGIVIGLALSRDGGDTEMSLRARKFAEQLTASGSAPVILADERHTTQFAEAPMKEAGMSSRKRRGKVDAGAAVVLLMEYLRSHPGSAA